MSLLSAGFLAWVVGAVSLFWLAPAGWRHRALSLLTLAFLLVHAPLSGGILVACTLVTWAAGRRAKENGVQVALASAALVTLLVYCKLGVVVGDGSAEAVLVPLGLSYYTLRCVHYLVESYKGTLRPHGPLDLVTYLFFLPTLLAGPIHRFGDYHRDLRRHRWDGGGILRGLERMVIGYAKITILANFVISTHLATYVSELAPGRLAASLDCATYGLNLYLQFAGYSDVAIGLSLVLGFKVMENFEYPFFKPNISEFWKAWHISLSSWCRDYIYMVVVARTRLRLPAVVATMVAIGLWHELSWRYLVWGGYHALGILVWTEFQRWKPRLPRLPEGRTAALVGRGLATLVTALFVLLSFAITKEGDLAAAFAVYRTLLLGS